MNKIKNEEIINFFKENGYTFIDNNCELFANNYYWCIQDSTGYFCKICYSNLKNRNSSPVVFGYGNERHLDNMAIFINKKNPNIEILELKDIKKNNRNRTLVKMKCECGNIFTQTFGDIYKNTRICCQKCTNKFRGKTKRESKDVFDLIYKLGYKILEKLDNPTKTQKILVENKDGYRGYVTYKDLARGCDMTIISENINKDNLIYNINIYAKKNNIKSFAIGFNNDNNYSRTALNFMCECGNIFTTSYASFMNKKTRCEKCTSSISRYEDEVKRFLEQNNIEYIYQFKINSCKDICVLPFDFCIKDSGKLIEIDGEQHFKPATFCKKAILPNENFEYVKKHDKIKDEYCKKWNIPLLRISYKEILDKTYKDKIIQFIKE